MYKSQKEFEKEIKNGKFYSNQSIDISAFDLYLWADIKVNESIKARNIRIRSIKAHNINALEIHASYIYAKNINAHDIIGGNINAQNIKAHDINVGHIEAKNINAWDINTLNIKARNINALNIISRENIITKNIVYGGVVVAYNNIKTKSIKGLEKNAKHLVLNGKITIEKGGK